MNVRLSVIMASAALAGCATMQSASDPQPMPPAPLAAVPPASPTAAPAGMQYLYGSGEGGAIALTAMHALIAYAEVQAAHRPANSVVLAHGSALKGASFVPCGDKPLAVVFDADETLIWNLGFEARAAAGEKYDQDRWDRFEQGDGASLIAVPGAVHVLTDLRKLGVTPVINTNRKAAFADKTVAALRAVGLGDFVHGETLFLQGDGGPGTGKDVRREAIAARYCVIAMAGDQLGDFADAFNVGLSFADRHTLAIHGSAAGLWGKGWFVLPNPVYGSGLKGGIDDVFPADKRWTDAATDPAEEKKP